MYKYIYVYHGKKIIIISYLHAEMCLQADTTYIRTYPQQQQHMGNTDGVTIL